jgi:gliding motility-associated-like protein
MRKVKLLIFVISILAFVGGNLFAQDIIMTTGTQSVCSGTFMDPGGNGDYSNDEEEELTLCPDVAGQAISVTFVEFDTEATYDHLYIYDGSSTASPLITGINGVTDGEYDGTALQGQTITSTSSDGCLTFVWDSDFSTTSSGWLADISCAAGCQTIVANATSDGTTIAGDIASCTGQTIAFACAPTFPDNGLTYTQDVASCTFDWDFGNGQTATTQNADATFGTQGTYNVSLTITDNNNCSTVETYVVNVTCGGTCPPCTDIIVSDPDVNTCSGTFWDPGMTGDYSNNEEEEITICPDAAGQAISVNFIEFNTESNYDHLYIYDGNSTTSPLITGINGVADGEYDGTSLQGETVTSTSGDGCLTFVWDSDGSTVNSGWIGDISCAAGCQTIVANATAGGTAIAGDIASCTGETITFECAPTFPDNGINYTQDVASCTFAWDFGNGQTATTQNADATFGTQGTYNVSLTITDNNNCSTVETYVVNVTCGGACPPCTDIIVSDPDVNTCSGTFWDPGMTGDYSNNEEEEITICPDAAGQAISVNFIEFNTESNYDHLYIYDGNSTTSPLITGINGVADGEYDGTSLQGETVTSTSGDGCLTFVWDSDGSTVNSGWIGDISCAAGCQTIVANATAGGTAIAGDIASCTGETITFECAPTFPDNGINYTQDVATCTFEWDFGNGQTSTNQNASVTYGTQGAYDVALTITDNNNCSTVETYVVNVTCGGACPPCTDIIIGDPTVYTCMGTFWDTGLNDDYSANEDLTTTICSDNGGFPTIHFIEFETESVDDLMIYDGPDDTAPLIGTYDGTNIPPDITATGTCLTFVWDSDGSVQRTGWKAEISCLHPCQEFEAEITSNPELSDNGTIYTCPGGIIDFSTVVSFPNNDVDYHQDLASSTITWSAFNGASGNGNTFTMPIDSAFSTEVFLDVEDNNGCHFRDTIPLVSECQAVNISIDADASIQQSGEIFLSDASVPLNLDGTYEFPEDGLCYNQNLGELTWTFGYLDGAGGVLVGSNDEDPTATFPDNGVYEVVFSVEDQEGCSNETTVEVHVGCQPIDVTWEGNPAMIGDTIIVCPGDSFSLEVFTDYFANGELYEQDDATNTYNWNMADGTLFNDTENPGVYAYDESGLFMINLQIVDNNGCPDNTHIPVLAFMEPSLAGTTMSQDTICFGDSLILYGNTTIDMPTYSAPPVFLPDGNDEYYTSTLTFDMFGDAILTSVNDIISICLNMEHSFTGDLSIGIMCPNGSTTEFIPYPNGLGGHYLGEPVDNTTGDIGVGYEYCFTPTATQTWQDIDGMYTYTYTDQTGTEVTDHQHIPAGEYAPTGDFTNLLGCPLNGDWSIVVTDNLNIDDGWIFDWSITLNQEGLLPPDTTQLPIDMREWTVETGGDAVINMFDQDDAYATPLDTGMYTFTFTTISPAGCSYDTTIGPLYVAPMPEWTLGDDDFVCAGYDYTIPGTLVNGDGVWTSVGPGNATFTNPTTIPTDVTVDAYGQYTFYFTPNTIALCAIPDSIVVTFHELPTVSEVIDSVNCFGVCDGSVTVTPLGVELPYQYLWSNGDTGVMADSLCEGFVELTVTSDYCTNSYTYNVYQPTLVQVIDSGKVDNLCFDDSEGEVWVTAEGGNPGYNYVWDPVNPNNSSLSGLIDGTYRVTVSDYYGCEAYASVTVNGPENVLSIDAILSTDVACSGENNGTLEAYVSGGTEPYMYSWTLNGNEVSVEHLATGLAPGNYNLLVTDANGCITTGSQIVSEPPALLASYFVEPTTCFGYSDGKVWVEPESGTPPYTYEWSNGWQDSVIINTAAGYYSVTITDSRGCNVSFEGLEVEQPNQVMVAIPSSPTICIGESVDLLMSVTSSPFTPYTYYWNGVVGNEMLTVSPSETTSYTAQVIDSQGCESIIMTTEVEVFEPFTSQTTLDRIEVCLGELVTISTDVTGGNGNTIYTLSDGQQVGPEFVLQPEETQEFSITISDNCGTPSITNVFEIVVNEPYLPSLHADTKAGCNPLIVNFLQDTEGHQEGTEYLWTFGDASNNSMSYESNPTHIFTNDGQFDVNLEITTPEGCLSSKTKHNYITVFPVPDASFVANPTITTIVDPNVYFENHTTGADYCIWNFGDGDTTIAWSVEHNYPSYVSDYYAELIAVTRFGCLDSMSVKVRIVDEISFHIPTGFTPDDDGRNEVFRPLGNGIVANDYYMAVYDRWGEIIFETNDLNKGWDGKVKGNSIAKPGVYTYIIRFFDTYGVPHERAGSVSLLR